MKDGKIDPSTEAPFGFSESLFNDSFLWKAGNEIYLSLIISQHPGRGNVRRLIKNILKEGYIVKIPTPLGILGGT